MHRIKTLLSLILLFNICLSLPMKINAEGVGAVSAPHRVPEPPPPPPAPCPPMPPNVELEHNCKVLTLDELREKYLETEGEKKRGLNFYFYAMELFEKHKLYKVTARDQVNYSFNTQKLLGQLGTPDYIKTFKKNNTTMKAYAYVFTNKSYRDYVMIVYTANELIYRIGYTETSLAIGKSWIRVE